MTVEPKVWVDVESAVRVWARGVWGPRVFFGVNNKAPFPQVILRRVAGNDQQTLVQFDVWAYSKAQAAENAASLATAADALARFIHEGTVLHGSVVESISWQPDEVSDKPRYVVDVTFTATAVA